MSTPPERDTETERVPELASDRVSEKLDEVFDKPFETKPGVSEKRSKAEKRNRQRVRTIFKEAELHFLRSDDGDLVLLFDKNEDRYFETRIYIEFSGSVISSLGIPSIEVRPFEKEKALEFCNKWNSERRWPTATYEEKLEKIVVRTNLDGDLITRKDALEQYLMGIVLRLTLDCFDELAKEW